MERRDFLTILAATVAASLASCTASQTTERALGIKPSPRANRPHDDIALQQFSPPVGITKIPVPYGTIYRLPEATNQVALTVDDGTDEAVLAGYARLARDTGLRLTFFCNGINRSWSQHADLLRPLSDNNQVFIANHTWSHPNLLTLPHARITEEVRRNERFLKNTYGVSGRPFLRPPFGYHDRRVAAQLADLGYPALTMWWGTLGDATVETPTQIVANAEEWLLPGRIVIGHANHRPVMTVYGNLVEIIRARQLQPVHLGDIYSA